MPTGLCSGDGSKADRSMTGSLSRPPRQDSRIFIPIEYVMVLLSWFADKSMSLSTRISLGVLPPAFFYLHQMEKAVFWINPEYSNAVVSAVGHI